MPRETAKPHSAAPPSGEANEPFAPSRPIFVLGSARSGTTIVSSAIQKMTRYDLISEGHIWPLVYNLNRLTARYFNSVREAFPTESQCRLLSRTSGEFDQAIIDAVIRLFNLRDPRFVDKTPGVDMIKSIDIIEKVYPRASFVFVRRHPIQTLLSKQRKFPKTDFASHCVDWVNCMEGWQAAAGSIRCGLEIEHADLGEQTAGVGEAIVKRLGLAPSAAAEFEGEIRANMQVERTAADPSADATTIREVAWSEEEKLAFVKVVAPVAERFGYDIYGDPALESREGRISIFFPARSNASVAVLGRNDFSYPIFHGFQMCPNLPDKEAIALVVRNLSLRSRFHLSYTVRREFLDGPTCLVKVVILKSGSGQPVNEFDHYVDNIEPHPVSFDIDPISDPVDLTLSVHLVGAITNAYATVLITSAMITRS